MENAVSPMVEKVARTIGREFDGHEGRWVDWVRHARAAIAVMREPTEGMLKVGRERREGLLMSAPSHIYQGMIDAALSPAESGRISEAAHRAMVNPLLVWPEPLSPAE